MVEIMIVVAIIALLAAMAMPGLISARKRAQEARFITDLRVYKDAVTLFLVENPRGMDVLTNTPSSSINPLFEDYFQGKLDGDNSLGGEWDTQVNATNVTLAVGSHFRGGIHSSTREQLDRIDARIDNGDVLTGQVRLIAGDRYYYVIMN